MYFTAENGIQLQSGFPTKKENGKQPLRPAVHLQRHQIHLPLIPHRTHRRIQKQSTIKVPENHIQIKLLVGIEGEVTMWTMLK